MKLPLIIQFIIFLFFIRGLIIILHELGHALPAILLTKEKVSIYIGSYGDQKKSINFKLDF